MEDIEELKKEKDLAYNLYYSIYVLVDNRQAKVLSAQIAITEAEQTLATRKKILADAEKDLAEQFAKIKTARQNLLGYYPQKIEPIIENTKDTQERLDREVF
jgi:predicted Zn-dependent peptidase